MPDASKPTWAAGKWRGPIISRREVADLRKAAIVQGHDWPWDKELTEEEKAKPTGMKNYGLMQRLHMRGEISHKSRTRLLRETFQWKANRARGCERQKLRQIISGKLTACLLPSSDRLKELQDQIDQLKALEKVCLCAEPAREHRIQK